MAVCGSDGVFFYTGSLHEHRVPEGVTKVVCREDVEVIRSAAFDEQTNIEEIVLNEGLVEIEEGPWPFRQPFAASAIVLSSGSVSLLDYAVCKLFYTDTHNSTYRKHEEAPLIALPDGLEGMGAQAFLFSDAANVRVPASLIELPEEAFRANKSLLSVEVAGTVERIGAEAFLGGNVLRSLALPASCEVAPDAFASCTDLLTLFKSAEGIETALKTRFDGLPVHELLYRQCHLPEDEALERLRIATSGRSGSRPLRAAAGTRTESGARRDGMGMTCLHVLACSSRQTEDMHRLLAERYPEAVCAKDSWGALPVHYALYSGASEEIVNFLLHFHYQQDFLSFFDPSVPDVEEVDWHHVMEFLAMNNANRDRIGYAVKALIEHGWVADVRWKDLLLKMAAPNVSPSERFAYTHTLSYMAGCAMYLLVEDWRVEVKIGIKKWRDGIINQPIWFRSNTYGQPVLGTGELLEALFRQVDEYEARCDELAAQLSVLELAVWKARMETSTLATDRMRRRCKKRSRDDEATFRHQCRVGCGAQQVIENVLPFLTEDVEPVSPRPDFGYVDL
ncbi:hypothetical protein THAOC_14244 [Thalassiosira oceanica]|uniref:Uncharacterized protein n=1 Tax=Thalassiosira oceanica TaxID=159749 RepID=K0T3E6_THAOC|nr:hypothetical protein THAOC_14244 [Thalassiosira oceanica]|eukprot:EJK64962.1 hypothetical protein THAOC_14244 [Thalassiosira oceanica]